MPIVKFEENLIEISQGNTWEEATKEWAFVNCDKKDSKDNHCLCGFPLKNQYYYVNRNTNKYICCGYGCKKHIDPYIVKVNDKRYTSDLKDIILDELIDYDLEAYCLANKERIFNKFINNIDKYHTEEELVEYAKYLDEYWFELDIDDILDKIDEKRQLLLDREEAKKRHNEALLLAKQKRIDAQNKKLEEETIKHKLEYTKYIEELALKKREDKMKRNKQLKELEEYKLQYKTEKKQLEQLKEKIILLEKQTDNTCCQALFKCDCKYSNVVTERRAVRRSSNEAEYGDDLDEEALALKMLEEEESWIK